MRICSGQVPLRGGQEHPLDGAGLRWIQNDPDTYVLRDLDLTSDTKAVEDMKGNRLLLFTSDWAIRWAETHNETLKLSEFGNI